MYDTILFPTDGSEGSEEAEQIALGLAEQFQGTVHTMHVIDTRLFSEPALSTMELVTDVAEDAAMKLLHEVSEEGDERDIEVTTHCCHGVPHEEILDYAEEIDADIIVMGYQGQTHSQKMGSVVNRVLQDTDRQVLAV
jgi:nucleotide-binding universal stress UspA family protein